MRGKSYTASADWMFAPTAAACSVLLHLQSWVHILSFSHPLILSNFPLSYDIHKSPEAIPLPSHDRLTDLPLTITLPAWFIFFDHKSFRTRTMFPPS